MATRSEPVWMLPTLLLVSVAVPTFGWLLWLNWHAEDETWQVYGLLLSLCVVALAGGWLRRALITVFTLTFATTVMFSIDGSTEKTTDANLWMAGAIGLVFVAFLGLGAVAGSALLVRVTVDRMRRRHPAE